jgi:glycosyltransferase involved in cell wall biosynthesis
MKILFLADNFPPEKNAQASRVYERACYWTDWGNSVTVITCAPNFPDGKVYSGFRNRLRQIQFDAGIKITRVITFIAPNAGRVLRIVDFLSYMVSAFIAGLLEPRADVVVATSPQFFAAVAGCTLAAVKRVPFIMEVSDLWPDSIVAVGAMKHNLAMRWIEKIELYMYRRAARVVVLTKSFRENLIRRGVPATKIDVVINGVDLRRYAPKPKAHALGCTWGIGPKEFVIGYIGTLGMAHGLMNVLAAAERCGSSIRFLFVGPGAEREALIAEAKRKELKNVTFVPAQAKERISDFWSLCDAALIHLKNTPLFATVIPSKIFEAMAMGLPLLLVAPRGEASGIVEKENAGIWVAPDNPHELANAALLLAGNAELRMRLAAASRAAAARYSRERQAAEMLSSFERALMFDLVEK